MICSRTYPNLRPIALLLPGTVGAKVAHYRGKRDMTETHAGMPIIAIISPFQVRGIHLDIILQFPPRPCVPAPSSDIYRPRNSAPECRFSACFFSMKTGSNRAKKAALSSVWCALKHIPTSTPSEHSFLEHHHGLQMSRPNVHMGHRRPQETESPFSLIISVGSIILHQNSSLPVNSSSL